MKYFAEIDSDTNKVLRVLVVGDDVFDGNAFLSEELKLGGTWIQTCKDTRSGINEAGGTPLRKNYACPGYAYDAKLDAFIPPKPTFHPSWIFNEDTCNWSPPVPRPNDGKMYIWDEPTLSWVELTKR